jgi:hypothetical protein
VGGNLSGRDRRDADIPGDDWARYGGAWRKASEPDRPELLGGDPFLDYRYEGIKLDQSAQPPATRPRSRANAIGVLIAVIILAGAAAFFSLSSANVAPLPVDTPAPRPTVHLGSASPTTLIESTPQLSHVAVTIQTPLPIFVPDRDSNPDDGTTMYLVGSSGGFPVDVAQGIHGTVWGGAAFPAGLRKSIFDSGLWVSSWPKSYTACGPDCWDKATTYRIDPATGAVTLKLESTYLVGASFGGVDVASQGQVSTVDPSDGTVLSGVPWRQAGEPRVGCGSLWSVQLGSANTILNLIDTASGYALGASMLAEDITSGPFSAEGQCWMMTGQGGASASSTSLVWILPNGSVEGDRQYGVSLVLLDSEFWELLGDGTIQRLDVTSNIGIGYGHRFQLAVTPPNNDPKWLFASLGKLWLYTGTDLVGFDIPTGASAVNS